MTIRDLVRQLNKIREHVDELLEEFPDFASIDAFESLEEAGRNLNIVVSLISEHNEEGD